jgi:hypothetical protein
MACGAMIVGLRGAQPNLQKLTLPSNNRDTRMSSTFSKLSLILALALCTNTANAESHIALDFTMLNEGASYGISTGWSGYLLEDEGWGSYANVFTDWSNETDWGSKTALHNYSNPNLKQNLFIVDVGKTRRVIGTDFASYYIGIGYAEMACPSTRLYPNYLRTPTSPCNAENPVKDRRGINLNTGVLVEVKHVMLNIGYHSFLNKVYVGLGLSF